MALPIVEQIAADLLTTLDGLSTEAGTLDAKRPTRHGGRDHTLGDLVTLIEQTRNERLEGMAGGWWCRQHFDLAVYLRSSDDASTPIDTRCNQAAASLIVALMADKTRGGLATRTDWGGFYMFVTSDGAFSGVVVEITVDYRTNLDDPYTELG